MIQLVCIFVLAFECTCLPNPAPYIHASNRPLNIAHRGLCSILPENTLQAFLSALYQGADFIELDVVYTKEKNLLVMHDPYLTRITDIKSKPQFATRYTTRTYNGFRKTDWWTDQFTLNQLKTLTISQHQAPGRLTIFDYKFTFPTLKEVIEAVLAFNEQHKGHRNPDGRLAGILIEAKDSQMYRDLYGLQIGKDILQTLRKYGLDNIQNCTNICPIYLHSFDYGTIQYWAKNTELPRNYLIESGTSFDLEDINLYATGVGFQDSLIWNYTTQSVLPTLQESKDLGLLVHIWTFKDDIVMFNSSCNIEMYKFAQLKLKLDGVITEFADIYTPIAQLLRNNQTSSQSISQLSQNNLRIN